MIAYALAVCTSQDYVFIVIILCSYSEMIVLHHHAPIADTKT